MKCIHCGKKISAGQPVCPFCGTSQGHTEKTVNPAQENTKKSINPAQEQVSLAQMQQKKPAKGNKKKATKKQIILRIVIIIVAILLALVIVAVSLISGMLNQVQKASELSGDIGVNEDLGTGVQNIMLFGLDTRKNNDTGRSDAMIVLSIDRDHNKIKMTSLARDTYVAIEGRKNDKLTHAWAYGKAQLAVKTINQNFDLNVTDYAYINFFEFVDLIDYIGGVDIDVSAAELKVVNNYYCPELNLQVGIHCDPIPGTGLQHLTGAQALAYSRNRYTGSDIDRGNRQKKVLEAAYQQVKNVSITKYPSMISKILGLCHTNLTQSEMLSIATWAITKHPTIEMFSLPTKDCKAKSGKDAYINGRWYYIYDLDIATEALHRFIYETDGYVSPTHTPVNSGSKLTQAATPGNTTTALKTVPTTSAVPTTGIYIPVETDPSETSPTEPTEPTEPTQPTQPTEPTEPETQPTEPTEPKAEE